MRRISYVAAAAAGVIAPLAIALPAVAGTEVPALGGVSVVGEANNDDGNNDDDIENHFDDLDDDDLDNGDNGDGSNDDEDIEVVASGSRASGDVALIVSGSDLGSFDEFEVNSPSLDAGCESNSLNGATLESDRLGEINVAVTAEECVPGEYAISVSQTGGQEETFVDEVTID